MTGVADGSAAGAPLESSSEAPEPPFWQDPTIFGVISAWLCRQVDSLGNWDLLAARQLGRRDRIEQVERRLR